MYYSEGVFFLETLVVYIFTGQKIEHFMKKEIFHLFE
jgi:hypothetical protein